MQILARSAHSISIRFVYNHSNEQPERYAGADVPALFFPTPAPALCRLGQSRRAAAAAGPWRPRSLPQLGLGGPGAAQGLAHRRPDLRGHGDASGRPTATTRWRPTSTTSPSSSISRAGAGDDRGPFAGRQHRLRYAGIYPERVRKLVAIEGLGPSPKMIAERARRPWPSACGNGSTSSASSPAACRAATRPSRTPSSACRRRTSTSPPNRRGTHAAGRHPERGRHL